MNRTNLTIVVYTVHTRPVASTAAHNSNPVTDKIKREKTQFETGFLLVNLGRGPQNTLYLRLVQRQGCKHTLPYR